MVRTRVIPLAEQLLDTLGEQGYRSTSPRKAVAQAIAGTIYRALKLLVDSGALCRVLLEDGNLHYQLSHQGHHHHLLCVECGSSQDLLGCDIEDLLHQVSAAHRFQLSGHWLEVYGRCYDCLPKTATG